MSGQEQDMGRINFSFVEIYTLALEAGSAQLVGVSKLIAVGISNSNKI